MKDEVSVQLPDCPEHAPTTYNLNYPPPAETLSFPLSSAGHVDHWLIAGPQAIPVTDLSGYDDVQPRPGIMRDYSRSELLVREEPLEGEELIISDAHGPASFLWQMKKCGADHFVDLTTFGFTCHYMRTWAYVTLYSPVAVPKARLILTVNGPADVWVNGTHVKRHTEFYFQVPARVEFSADLRAGENAITIAYEVIAIRECPYAMALQLVDTGGVAINAFQARLRTTYPTEQRSEVESVLKGVALERPMVHGHDRIALRWPSNVPGEDLRFTIRMESLPIEGLGQTLPKPKVHWERTLIAESDGIVEIGTANLFSPGRHVLILEADGVPFPASRRIPVRIARGEFSVGPYGSVDERVREALEAAAARDDQPYGEIAKMALGRWGTLRLEPWEDPLVRLKKRADCSDFVLIGMLGALQRFGHDPRFPRDLREGITHGALNYRYWMDEPGGDAMCFHTENHQILFHTCEVLAGQLFPDQVFPNSGQTGSWHAEKGARLAMNWLGRKAVEGFQEWDSNVYFEIDIVALSHLADLAQDPEVATMASMVLDKILLQMALNSFRGVFGSTHGRVYMELIKGARLELTSGVCRILWGMGVFNDNITGTVSLACARNYTLPTVIRDIALGDEQEMWNRERHGGCYNLKSDCREGEWEVNKVTYKTSDYMLCSAQDYLPGRPGNQQHIWQATLGPDTMVFSTHPVCLAEDGAHRPNFWHGNGTLPRVAQWKNFLVALYNLPADDWMGFTHAYFPTFHFDEWVLRGSWIFGRKADGYVALYASLGLELATASNGVREELRSYGHHNVWLCQMGRAVDDGSFEEFQNSILAADVQVNGLHVTARLSSGDVVEFSWDGPFVINGRPEAITGFPHYENRYCTSEYGAAKVRIQSEQNWLEWDFAKATRTMGRRDA